MELLCSFGRLRPWREGDESSLVESANDRSIWVEVRDAFPFPYTWEDAEEWVEIANDGVDVTDFAIEVDGRAVGGIGYSPQPDVNRCSAEVGYWLGRAYWGRGIVSEALRELSGTIFALHPEIVRLFALPFADNPASRRVLEKCGYRLEAVLRDAAVKDGRLRDQAIYALLRRDL